MPIYSPVTLGSSWSLIYDTATLGSFAGGISRNGGSTAFIQAGLTPPSASASGIQVEATASISLSAAAGEKLYGRALSDTSIVQMVDELYPDAFPPGVFEGARAITVQGYPEANVKNGLQFNLRAAWPLLDVIPTGTSRKIWFKTNAKTVIVKLREFQYIAEELKIELFASPTGVSGGTDLTIHNYNGVNPVATTVLAKKNVTITNNGTPFDNGDPEYFYGSSNDPQRQSTQSIPSGRERILPKNTEFAVVITNTGTGNSRVQYYLDWYEGEPDLPVPN